MIRDWVELNMTPGIGPRAAAKLLERFGSAEAVYSATRAELEQLRLVPEAVDCIIARDLQERAEVEIATVRKLGGDILDHKSQEKKIEGVEGPPEKAGQKSRALCFVQRPKNAQRFHGRI